MPVEHGKDRRSVTLDPVCVLGLQRDPQVRSIPGQVTQAQVGVVQAPLAFDLTAVEVQADEGRVHVCQVDLGAAGFRAGGDAAVGHHHTARLKAVPHQLMRVLAVGGPLALQRQGVRIAQAHPASAGVQVGFGAQEPPAVGAGEEVAVEAAIRAQPMPLGRLAGRPAQEPVTGSAGGGQQAALGVEAQAMGAGGNVDGRQSLQARRGAV